MPNPVPGPAFTLPQPPLPTVIVNTTTGSLRALFLDEGNAPGTRYQAQLSLDPTAAFSPVAASLNTTNTFADFQGLIPNQQYFFRAGTFAHDVEQGEEPPLLEREDGSWLVSGAASADLLADRLGVRMPNDRDYATVAGFALSVLKHLPKTGETFKHDGWSFEIIDLDGRKIDKLIVSRPRKKMPEAETQKVS